MNNHFSRDLAAVMLNADIDGVKRDIIIASAYFPGDSDSHPPTAEVKNLISFCTTQQIPYIIGCDANAHHSSWSSTNTNPRGESLFNYLLNVDACVANEGDSPTFSSNGRDEVLDITFCSSYLSPYIHNWHVSDERSLSDHNHILFNLRVNPDITERKRNPHKTDWNLFNDLVAYGSQALPTNFLSTNQLEDGANQLEDLLTNSFHSSTIIRGQNPTGNNCSWWNSELTELRKETRRLWNKAKKSGNFSHYKISLTLYNNAICNAKRTDWINFCDSVDHTHETARLHKTLNKKRTNDIGFLKKSSGSFTDSRQETIDLLLSTHFPDSTCVDPVQQTSISFSTTRSSKKSAKSIVTEDKVNWAIKSFHLFKAPGGDEIIPAMLQKSLPHISKTIVSLFRASLALCYIPRSWRKVNVIFIPKPGKDPNFPKSYRPISLSSFLLKALERIIENHIRETTLIINPLHPLQFAYMKGKSTELAALNLVSTIESNLNRGHPTLCAFMDIQGAFDNTGFMAINRALKEKQIDYTARRWIMSMLKNREIKGKLGDCSRTVVAAKGCPQGGVLSPLLWSLVIDDLLSTLNSDKIHTIGYADDLVLSITGKHEPTIRDLMESSLNRIHRWCKDRELSINPSKTILVPFHMKKSCTVPPTSFLNTIIPYSEEVIYLGIKLNRKLSWLPHLQWVTTKARKAIWACRSAAGANWGLSPKMCRYIYTAMVRPIITHASAVWWEVTKQTTGIDLCTKLQRTASIITTGCIRSCPSASMELLVGLDPLHLHILKTAANATIKMGCLRSISFPHNSPQGRLAQQIPRWNEITTFSDVILPYTNFVKNFTTDIPDRLTYANPNHLITGDPNSWYTDGSKTPYGSGAGIYNKNHKIHIPLGKTASVFQAEVHAILVCASHLTDNQINGQEISIYSDSQAAIKALDNVWCSSKCVMDCKTALNSLGLHNSVKLIWIPGHSNLAGNEEADRLANLGSAINITEPVLRLGHFYSKDVVEQWIRNLALDYWTSLPHLRQSKRLINPTLHCQIIHRSRRDTRQFIGFLTGHYATRSLLHKIGAITDSACRFCQSAEETTEHLLMNCGRFDLHRHSTLGKHRLEDQDVYSLPCKDLVILIREIAKALDLCTV